MDNLLLLLACRSRYQDGNDQALDDGDCSNARICEITDKTGAIRMNILHERGL
jgi:hypothetical protein